MDKEKLGALVKRKPLPAGAAAPAGRRPGNPGPQG